MDGFHVLGAGVAALLSYQMPVYAARLLGIEDQLNQVWASGMHDALPAQVLFVAFYMLMGFALWAVPAGLILWICHPERGENARGVLGLPFRPLKLAVLSGWDACVSALDERKTIRAIYKKEFAGEFASFAQFRRYYRWVNAQEFTDPRKPLSASSDGLKDAVAFLGLPDGFDEKALSSRYGVLMKQVHPDIAGPNDIARRLNEARDIIRARKGWR